IVGMGDSHTIKKMGLTEILESQNGDNLVTCFTDKSKANKLKTIASDIFLLSANAIAEDTGEMVNIDSSCNRVAGSLYGPAEVVFIIGKNKIEKDLAAAIYRARNIAAPINARAHNYGTPCVKTGKCENCFHPERICRATVIYHKRPKPMKATVILINQDLGF
ncbi:MAG: lactate utilization protein, partial [Alphaproteobacteria bacterium]|nr:lactate utilization protein [Alphaproteobacteria bacterium]